MHSDTVRLARVLAILALLPGLLFASGGNADTTATRAPAAPTTAPAAPTTVVAIPHPGSFELTLPAEFERVPVDDPRVGLAVRSRAGGFPTLTVIVEPGPFGPAQRRTVATRTERIVESYRSLGFTELSVTATTEHLIDSSPAVEWSLEYRHGGRLFLSRVLEVTFPDRRLTFTWLAPGTNAPPLSEPWAAIRASIRFADTPSRPPISTAPPRDFGPIYAETDMTRFPVEPWNTASNIVFLVLLVIFAQRTRLNRQRYPFMVPALVVLAVGFLGGTIYHATRSHDLWLILDFLPIAILTFATSLYFWFRVVRRRWLAVVACIGLLLGGKLFGVVLDMPLNVEISLSYVFAALAILVPAAIHGAGPGWPHRRYLIWATVLFGVAIVCRLFDRELGETVLPMGTHFLWHIFGGLSVGSLLQYVALMEEDEARHREQTTTGGELASA